MTYFKKENISFSILYILFAGPNTTRSHIYSYSIDMPSLSVGNQVIFHDLNTFPTDASSDGWYQESSGLILHKKGDEDTR